MSQSSKTQYGAELPPPYTLVSNATRTAGPSTHAHSVHSQPSSLSLFSAQLSGLRGQIRQEQAALSSARDQQDHETLSLLLPHVEELLDSIASINPPPTLVEATLVPDEAIHRSWRFSDTETKQSGHVVRLIRVGRRAKTHGDGKKAPALATSSDTADDDKEFDEWGRWNSESQGSAANSEAELWWSDEGMAHRLAKHLQPNRATASVDRSATRAQVEHIKDAKKAGRWSLFKKDGPSSPSQAPPNASQSQSDADDVGMTVRAEETTFRRQNEMGIWESKTGWGLVVRVQIRI